MSLSLGTILTPVLFICVCVNAAVAQQTVDNQFQYPITEPSYPSRSGPTVCVDEAHENHLTIGERFAPFATLLRDDGYQVVRSVGSFTSDVLSKCDVVVSVDPLSQVDQEKQGQYPHESAFTEEEVNELLGWVRDGGAFLLIADHTPWAGAVSGLLALLGMQVFDGQVQQTAVFGQPDEDALERVAKDAGVTVESFRQRIGRPGELGAHPITEGRHEAERVKSVWTFDGSALYPSRNVEPLLILAPEAVGTTALVLNWPVKPTEEHGFLLHRPGRPPDTIPAARSQELQRLLMPRFSLSGWLHGAAVPFGDGRVVVLADAAMCTAQFFGTSKVGMNAPVALDNAQFCLNVMHWVSGLLPG